MTRVAGASSLHLEAAMAEAELRLSHSLSIDRTAACVSALQILEVRPPRLHTSSSVCVACLLVFHPTCRLDLEEEEEEFYAQADPDYVI